MERAGWTHFYVVCDNEKIVGCGAIGSYWGKEDLLYKYSILEKYQRKFRAYFDGITYGASHGDYQGCQIIGENNRIKAIIDFSSARKLPIVWEIMRSFVQTSQESRLDCRINVEELCKYVETYCKVGVLTVQDLQSMPYVYLFQLLRSTYGYKENLQTNSEDRDDLIAFAFWRTRICKEVLAKVDEIAEGLLRGCTV